MNTYKFWYAPEIPRTLAIDQSISEDMASITLSHTERDLSRKDSETGNALTMYVSDFTLCIVPIGGRINLDAIKLFVMDLINLGGMKLAYNSTDRFQSEATVQYWKRQGLNVEYLSVDRTNDPYLFYVNMVQRGRVKCGRNIILKNNMLSIQMKKRKAVRKNGTSSVKIDHMLGEVKYTPPMNYNIKEKNSWKNSWNTCTTGNFSKDVLDSQVASIELLRKYSMIPYKIWNQEEIRDRNYDDVYEGVRQRAFNQGFLI
jgi:hypothetical protein